MKEGITNNDTFQFKTSNETLQVGDYARWGDRVGRIREIKTGTTEDSILGYYTEEDWYFPAGETQKIESPRKWIDECEAKLKKEMHVSMSQPLQHMNDSSALRSKLVEIIGRSTAPTTTEWIIREAQQLLDWINNKPPRLL